MADSPWRQITEFGPLQQLYIEGGAGGGIVICPNRQPFGISRESPMLPSPAMGARP